jgi:hypothetical protein
MLAHENMAKQNIFPECLQTTNAGGLFGYRVQVGIKESSHEAFLWRFGGGSGGDNNICNDGMGATVTGNRHHNQRI